MEDKLESVKPLNGSNSTSTNGFSQQWQGQGLSSNTLWNGNLKVIKLKLNTTKHYLNIYTLPLNMDFPVILEDKNGFQLVWADLKAYVD